MGQGVTEVCIDATKDSWNSSRCEFNASVTFPLCLKILSLPKDVKSFPAFIVLSIVALLICHKD